MLKNYRPKARADIIFPCLLLVIIVVPFLQLFYPVPKLVVTPDFGRSDTWNFSLPTKFFLGEKLRSGELPLWSHQIGAGFPVLGEGQTGVFFLPNLALYKLFTFPTAYNLSLVLIFVFFGLGMYLWLRLLNFPALMAIFGGVTLTFSGAMVAQIPHITMLQSFSLMPWVFYFATALIRKKSLVRFVLLSAVIAQQILAGFPQSVVITVFFTAAIYLWQVGWSWRRWKDYCLFGLAVGLSVVLSSVQILPSAEFLKYSSNPGGFSLADATYFSYPIKHLLTFLDPFALGNPKTATYPPFDKFDGSIFWENTGFVGWLPLLLVILTPVLWRRMSRSEKRFGKFSLAGLIISLLLMTGKYSPFYIAYLFWPLNLFRVPSRFIWIFILSIILIAGQNLAIIWRVTRRVTVKIIIIALAGLNLAHLLVVWHDYHAVEPSNLWLARPEISVSGENAGRIYTTGAETIHNKWFLSNGWKDKTPYFFLRNFYDADSNLFWGALQHKIYAGRFLKRPLYMDKLLFDSFQVEADGDLTKINDFGAKLLDMFAIGTVISDRQLATSHLSLVASRENDYGRLYQYKNTSALSRIYLAGKAVLSDTLEEATEKLRSADFIAGETVLLEEALEDTREMDRNGKVTTTKDLDTELVLSVTGHPQPGILVLTDTYYPGWEATIDGRKTHIYKANLRQRAIVVPEGDHEIVFMYRPQSFLYGAWLSGISWAVVLVFLSGSYVLRLRKLFKSA